MHKILITGGAGFIGCHLAKALILQGHSVTVYDNLRTGNPANLADLPVTFVRGDILDNNLLNATMRNHEIVFHLAALTSVAESMRNMEECIAINLHGVLNVLKTARNNLIQKVIFASSAAVYGDSPELPKCEAMPLRPKSPYAITKIDGEYYCRLFSESYNLQTACARFFNVFGEKQSPNSAYAAAIPIFIANCLKNEPVTIYGDGTQLRDFIYVKDLVNALILLMENGSGVFNVGYGKAIDINTIVGMIKNYLNSNSTIIYASERPGEVKNSYASIQKITSLGFEPEFSFDTGLFRTIYYFNEQALRLC